MPSRTDESLSDGVEALLPLVTQPARYLGTEIGVLRRPWADERVRWLLILPDVYEIGMSHQGLRILYDILNRRADALAERAFAPWIDMEARMRRSGLPLFSLESRRPARAFDIVGFSLQYELLATNILNLLDLAGIPLPSVARGEDDPLVAAGGPGTGNPEPLADFIDFFLIGDGEEMVGSITAALQATRGRPRRERLLALAQLPGIYVPRFYEPILEAGRQVGMRAIEAVPLPVRRTHVADLDAAPYPERPIVPLIEAVQDRLTLEIQRGCTQGCRFCQAGTFYRPVRERRPERLADLIAAGLPATGWSEVSLSSLSSADYSQVAPLARALTEAFARQRVGLSFSSLRVDTFSVELAELVARVRKTGFTFAPEAGTQRLRDVINKRVSDEDLLASVEAAYARGWRNVKLYFMVGLPTETPADLDAIAALAARIREIGRRHGAGSRVTVSIGGFVPKAHTPFQWEAFAGREVLHEKIAHLRERAHTRFSPVKWHDPDVSYVEAVLSRGDRRLGAAIEAAWRAGGRFDGWSDHFDLARWEEAFRTTGVDPAAYTGALDPAASLPWDHIDLGIAPSFLRAERERALRGETSPDCRDGRCQGCGLACGDERALAPELDAAAWDRLRDRLAAALGGGEPALEPGGPELAPEPGRSEPAMTPGTGPSQPAAAPPAPAIVAGAETTIRRRILFAKTGRLRFISHLEAGRLLNRVLRMARWPLAFTVGHNPHPRIAYGPPLPLGVEGERELIDIHLTAPLDGLLLAAANQHAPEGLTFLGDSPVPVGAPSLAAAAAAAQYRVRVPGDLADRARRELRLEAFAAAGAVPLLKASKGRQRTVDLKRGVLRLEWATGEAAGPGPGGPGAGAPGPAEPNPGEPGPGEPGPGGPGAGAVLRLDLRLQDAAGHVAGPFPVLREVFKWTEEELARCRTVRVRLLDERGRPLG